MASSSPSSEHADGGRPEGLTFRRSPTLLLHWAEETLLLQNYAVPCSVRAHPAIVELLDQFGRWTPLSDYLDRQPAEARDFAARLVAELHRHRFLRRSDDTLLPAEAGMEAWDKWNPSAGLFHTATRNTPFIDLDVFVSKLIEKQDVRPRPAAVKRYEAAPSVELPRPRLRGAFPAVLRDRRTWRRFGRRPIDADSLSALLQLSFGVQGWATTHGEGRVPLKTSPSGGARHPLEAYVVVRRVAGLDAGVYHYASDVHRLERLPFAGPLPSFDEVLPTQWWYRGAGVVVFLTAVFARTQWRYEGPRAYRAVLVEAGHVCQTFCLTATWLGLAPFCSMALADTVIENMLGLDGVSEAVLYAAGAGSRPARSSRRPPGAVPNGPGGRD
jgi:SagB-type dehydrogenase family enzyme